MITCEVYLCGVGSIELKMSNKRKSDFNLGFNLSKKKSLRQCSFVSRVGGQNKQHAILGIQEFEPKEFATQINLSLKNAWEIVRHILLTFVQLPVGNYILMKDHERPMLHVYDIGGDKVLS